MAKKETVFSLHKNEILSVKVHPAEIVKTIASQQLFMAMTKHHFMCPWIITLLH
jgi:hypothetical protein